MPFLKFLISRVARYVNGLYTPSASLLPRYRGRATFFEIPKLLKNTGKNCATYFFTITNAFTFGLLKALCYLRTM